MDGSVLPIAPWALDNPETGLYDGAVVRLPQSPRVGVRAIAKTLRVGCIGAGGIVRATHLPVLKSFRGLEVAWLADVDVARAEELGRAYKIAACPLPSNLDDLPEADIYLLACPYGVRMPYYEALRSRNVAIYVEKPFSRVPQEHERICSWFPEHALASGLMMRCWGPNQLVRRVVRQELFGPLRAVRFGFGRPGLVTHGRYYFDVGKGGAGMMAEVGIHGIDTALFVSEAVTANLDKVNCIAEGDFDLHTEARLILQNAAGRAVDFTFTVSSLAQTIEGIECEFDHAVLFWPLPGQGYAHFAESVDMNVKVKPKASHSHYTLIPGPTALYPATKFQMFHENWRQFLQGRVSEQANFTSASHARLTSEVIYNCYQAAAENRTDQ